MVFQAGSPTALAKDGLEEKLRSKANSGSYGLYVPAGAFWGGEDIKKMSDRGTLKVCYQMLLLFPRIIMLQDTSVLQVRRKSENDGESMGTVGLENCR